MTKIVSINFEVPEDITTTSLCLLLRGAILQQDVQTFKALALGVKSISLTQGMLAPLNAVYFEPGDRTRYFVASYRLDDWAAHQAGFSDNFPVYAFIFGPASRPMFGMVQADPERYLDASYMRQTFSLLDRDTHLKWTVNAALVLCEYLYGRQIDPEILPSLEWKENWREQLAPINHHEQDPKTH